MSLKSGVALMLHSSRGPELRSFFDPQTCQLASSTPRRAGELLSSPNWFQLLTGNYCVRNFVAVAAAVGIAESLIQKFQTKKNAERSLSPARQHAKTL